MTIVRELELELGIGICGIDSHTATLEISLVGVSSVGTAVQPTNDAIA